MQELLENKEFLQELKDSIESGKSSDWGYNGEYEFEYETYDSDWAFNKVIETLKKYL